MKQRERLGVKQGHPLGVGVVGAAGHQREQRGQRHARLGAREIAQAAGEHGLPHERNAAKIAERIARHQIRQALDPPTGQVRVERQRLRRDRVRQLVERHRLEVARRLRVVTEQAIAEADVAPQRLPAIDRRLPKRVAAVLDRRKASLVRRSLVAAARAHVRFVAGVEEERNAVARRLDPEHRRVAEDCFVEQRSQPLAPVTGGRRHDHVDEASAPRGRGVDSERAQRARHRADALAGTTTQPPIDDARRQITRRREADPGVDAHEMMRARGVAADLELRAALARGKTPAERRPPDDDAVVVRRRARQRRGWAIRRRMRGIPDGKMRAAAERAERERDQGEGGDSADGCSVHEIVIGGRTEKLRTFPDTTQMADFAGYFPTLVLSSWARWSCC